MSKTKYVKAKISNNQLQNLILSDFKYQTPRISDFPAIFLQLLIGIFSLYIFFAFTLFLKYNSFSTSTLISFIVCVIINIFLVLALIFWFKKPKFDLSKEYIPAYVKQINKKEYYLKPADKFYSVRYRISITTFNDLFPNGLNE